MTRSTPLSLISRMTAFERKRKKKQKRLIASRSRQDEQTADLRYMASSALPSSRSWKLILQDERRIVRVKIIPRGLSSATRIRFYEKFLFRLRVSSREHLFATSPVRSRAEKRILRWLSAFKITLFSLVFLS